ncbi:peptidase domain-containing ABC transporter [Anaeroselena agilis]|uniref:Type I secretion system permease/ATPase n=1 Tax=Anaeroselena agilis TaxID=3063788 RepID=A0ABU3NSI5_9FIRM|nr:type I secretion system permease/ATPase [Selenomonadales bacterium 4137-cl]
MDLQLATGQQAGVVSRRADTALACLVTAARLLGIPADADQMRRAYVVSNATMDGVAFVRAAADLGLKARQAGVDTDKLASLPLPAALVLDNGCFVLAVRREGGRLVIFDPRRDNPAAIPLETLRAAWSGRVILIARRHVRKGVGPGFGIGWFIAAIAPYKRFLGEVLFVSFVLQLFGLVSPLFTQVIIDRVLVHRSLGTLDILVLGMAAAAIFQAWMTALRSYLFTNTTNKIDAALSARLFRHITALPVKYFGSWQVGDVVARVRELENVRQFVTGSGLSVLLDSVFTVVYIVVMFFYSPFLSVIALIALPLFVALNAVVTPIYRRRLNEKFVAGAENQAFLIEAVTGIQTVKSLAVEPHFIGKWEEMLARYVKTAFVTANMANIAGSVGGFIQQAANLAVLWAGAYAVMDNKLSIGELIAFQMLAGQVNAPVLRLVNTWQQLQQAKVSVDRLGDIMNAEAEPAYNPSRTTLPTVRGEVVFDRVSFRYRQDAPEVLHQVSINIKAGTRVGVVGRSGSGKSTLAKLIQRLYVPESGRVLIDGVDLSQVEPAWLRRQIGVVPQESYLFSGSVGENIAAAYPEASAEEVRAAAEIAGAEGFINDLPQGYDTHVGERGEALSGGQRQRIAIARALLPNPQVLIFDEATGALDYESERTIMNNLDRIAANRTMVMVAHRLATVRRCDQIIVLERGAVAESGTHDELLAKRGIYYQLHRLQEEE